jgi:hypothetical protein
MNAVTPLRHLLARLGLLLALVGVVTVQGTTAEGWMPVVDAAGNVSIVVCDGHMPDGMVMPGMSHDVDQKAPAKKPAGDHPCAFAGLGIADSPPPQIAVVVPPLPAIDAPVLARLAILPGRGLAAPPPPATGPPALV